ncbi:hypothetical protein [Yonghaparkia sp. Root332]|uniref:hypothetical protein n=1 Tax=Yonghaparkia sp. Root332 TaxID=1736516 RepID=UPI000AEDDDBA|nr:hypothetical protein [Yonghaparkia sp. Root332]
MNLFSKKADADPAVPAAPASAPAGSASSSEDSAISWRDDRVGASARGENPMVMLELSSGWAVIGDTQFLPGYSLLISKHRDAAMLSQLTREQRLQFLADLDLLAIAVERACIEKDPAFRRVNIEILGNTDAYVHAHVFPRYEWEGPKAERPVWEYRDTHWTDELHEYKPGHQPLRDAITAQLRELSGVREEPEGPLAQPHEIELEGPVSTEPESAPEPQPVQDPQPALDQQPAQEQRPEPAPTAG